MNDLFKQDRSPGKHVSSAIYRVMGELHPDRFDPNREPSQMRLDLGNALERALADELALRFPDQYARPGELTLDGITGTPDLWLIPEWATVEIKLTWASSRRAEDIEDPWFWRYWSQIKSYCHLAGMTKGYLIVVFINGNYRRDGGGDPTAMAWSDTWSRVELAEHWQMIRRYA